MVLAVTVMLTSSASEVGHVQPEALPTRRLLLDDSVEKGRQYFVVIAPSRRGRTAQPPLCEPRPGHRDQLGYLSKVLGGGCEDELVTRAVGTS